MIRPPSRWSIQRSVQHRSSQYRSSQHHLRHWLLLLACCALVAHITVATAQTKALSSALLAGGSVDYIVSQNVMSSYGNTSGLGEPQRLSLEQLGLGQLSDMRGPALPVSATGRLLYDLSGLLPFAGQQADLLRIDADGQIWAYPLRLNLHRNTQSITFARMPAEGASLSGLRLDLREGWLHTPDGHRTPALQSGRGYRWDFASQHPQNGKAIRGQLLLQRLPQGGTLLIYHYTRMQGEELESGDVLLRY